MAQRRVRITVTSGKAVDLNYLLIEMGMGGLWTPIVAG
jgi:hypothetical protein